MLKPSSIPFIKLCVSRGSGKRLLFLNIAAAAAVVNYSIVWLEFERWNKKETHINKIRTIKAIISNY